MTPEAKLADVDWRVYVILDPRALPPGSDDSDLLDVAAAAIRGGAGVLQLRHESATSRRLVEMSRELAERCRRVGVLFIVNDRLDIAHAAGADGVHLGPDDIAIADARRVAPDLVVGGSAGTVDRARRLVSEGAHYLGCGAVYDAGPSKPDATHDRGPGFLTDIVGAVDVPVVGIGGITPDNAAAVFEAGADGVAVIRAVLGAHDPEAATRGLRR